MRRATVVVLAFVAALAAPLRAACGTECVAPAAPAARAATPECHEPAVPADAAPGSTVHCTHDHSASVRPAPKAGADVVAPQSAALLPSVAPRAVAVVLFAVSRPLDVSRGSPPLAINPPLRI